MIQIDAALSFAKELSIAAGARAKAKMSNHKTLEIEEKQAGDIVSSVDTAVEAMVREAIAERFPCHAFLGEESGGAIDGPTWIVDPIDGTSNFVRRAPFWCVSIALFEGERPVLGVVHDANLSETFAAVAGRGATCNDVPIKVRERETLDGATICFGFTRKRPSCITFGVLTQLADAGASFRSQGAGALSLCHLAAGRHDGFFEASINIWDVAAAALIVGEAGGWADYSMDPKNPTAAFPFVAGVVGLKIEMRSVCSSMMEMSDV